MRVAALAVAVLALAASALGLRKSYAGSQVLRLKVGSVADYARIEALNEALNLDLWAENKVLGYVDVRVDGRTRAAVKALDLPYEVYIEDVQAQIDAQIAGRTGKVVVSDEWFTEYHTYNETVAFVTELVVQYPDLLTPISIGTTYEGRSIFGVRLRGRGNPTKAVVFNGGQHAREWITPATVTGMLYRLVTEYGNVTQITELVDNLDFTIITILNPDGYEYTWSDDRMWRKNRKPTPGATCIGTDSNRNWEYMWNTGGSSNIPCNDAYMGPEPFWAEEAHSVHLYLEQLKAEGLEVAFYADVHAYSQLFMMPWGYTCNSEIPDHDRVLQLSVEAADILESYYGTQYTVGPICQVIYQASGSSADHTYATNGVKYSYALELRDLGRYGFQLPAEYIIPSIDETYPAFVHIWQAILDESRGKVLKH